MNNNITLIENLPKNPRHVKLTGLIVGISRKRSMRKQSITPYIIHLTDFTKPAYRLNQYFNDRNSFGKDFKQIVYDIDIFDEDLKLLKNYNELIRNVRYFEYFHGDIVYEVKNSGFNWNIGNLGIWVEVFIKGKIFNNILELKCESKQIRNLRINKNINDYDKDPNYPIWNKSINYFGIDVLKDVFEHDRSLKLANKTHDDTTRQDNARQDDTNEDNIHKDNDIVAVNYNKINLLKNSNNLNVNESYYVKVKIQKIVTQYTEYIFYNFKKNKFDIKNIDIVITENSGDKLLIEVKGEDLIRFLQIDDISIKNLNIEGLNFVNDRIKEEINIINNYSLDDNNYHNTNSKGMLIRPYEKLICGVLPNDVAVQAWLWIFNDVSTNN